MKHSRRLPSMFFVCFVCFAPALAMPQIRSQAPPPVTSLFSSLMTQGQAALKAEDYPSAQAALEKAIAARPSDVDAHYLLGRAYGQDKKYQFAAQQFRETLKLSPGHTLALIDLATIEETMGHFDEASAHYKQALKAGPNARADRGLASLLSKQGRQDEAIAALGRAMTAAPDDEETRYQLGLARMQKGDCAAAIPDFRAVLTRKPAHLGSLFNLGNCLNRTGAREEAARTLAQFQKASQDEAGRVGRRRRAYFLTLEADGKLESGDIAGAVKAMQEAIGLNPEDAGAQAMMGQAYDAAGDLPRALASYQKAAQLEPGDAMVLVEIGRLNGKAGRIADALSWLQRAARLDPLMPEPHMLMAAAYQQMGRTAEAAREDAIYRRLAAASRQTPAP
jgi:tetratricopeptide (TPR) repeat protein